MKPLITLLFSMILVFSVSAQSDSEVEDRVFDFCEVMPEYPGGVRQLRLDVLNAYTIPESEFSSGTIVTRFVIEKDGSIGEVLLVKSIENCEACNQEAIRVIQSLPNRFTPGLQAGKPVKINYTFPIVLKSDYKKKRKKRKSIFK